MSQANRRHVLFAVGALRAHGLSTEYAQSVAERVLEPDAILSDSDQEYLRIIRDSALLLADGLKVRN
jgi:hypothetical protein